MKRVKIFVKDECPRCPAAKALGKKMEDAGYHIEYFDVGTVEGLSEAAMNQVLATPTILVEDESETVIQAWRGTVPTVVEVLDAFL